MRRADLWAVLVDLRSKLQYFTNTLVSERRGFSKWDEVKAMGLSCDSMIETQPEQLATIPVDTARRF